MQDEIWSIQTKKSMTSTKAVLNMAIILAVNIIKSHKKN